MKKFFLILIFIITFQFYLLPEINNESEEGKYVYYHYNVSNINYYLGFFHIKSNSYLLRALNKNNGKEIILKFDIKIKNNNYEVIPGQLKGADDEESKNDLSTILALIFNILERYKRLDTKLFPKDVFIIDKFDDEFEHKFSYWIPIFNLNYLLNKTQNTFVLKLIKYGFITNDIEPFLGFNEIPKQKDDGPDLKLKREKLVNLKLKKTNIILDKNWVESSYLENPGYKINIASNSDAYLNIEELKMQNNNFLDEYQIIKLVLNSLSKDYIFPESINIQKYKDKLVLFIETIDPGTNVKNVLNLIILKVDKFEYNLINLSGFSSVYNQNKDYFQEIIKSIKK